MNEYLTVKDAANYLKVVTTHRLEVLRKQGKGPKYASFGTIVYYRPSDLDTWLEGEFKAPDAARGVASRKPASRGRGRPMKSPLEGDAA